MPRAVDALLLIGPPGAGKSFLGRHLAAVGVAHYVELEPILAERFGRGENFQARIAEAGAFLWRSYVEQLASSPLTVAIESTGVGDRRLLDALQRRYLVRFVRVEAPRDVCALRVVSRGADGNISASEDPERVGRFFDAWCERIAPSFRFDETVDGTDLASATRAIRGILGRTEG